MNWLNSRNLLIFRPDNMGDLIMSSPAIRALKETFGCRITVLTTPLAAEAAQLIPEIDETIKVTVPWIKAGKVLSSDEFFKLAEYLKTRNFDGCIIFTVYSQNPLPSAMLAWMAGIPKRLAYCRENPYELINNWIPDPEPYSYILHQVERDLRLVKHIGADTSEDKIILNIPVESCLSAEDKLKQIMRDDRDYVIIHAGVSELKRAYPTEKWIELSRTIIESFDLPIIFTGALNEKPLADKLKQESGENSYSVAGLFDICELAAIISKSRLMISVNTGPVHLAAGLGKPVLVLYARTNPQHKPWKTSGKVFEFSVSSKMKSKNEVIRFVNDSLYRSQLPYPDVSQIIPSVQSLLYKNVVQ
ncbi:MAG TPA: glycosyltransferase family 9 protein [Lentimicrobium sp.]|nr:glycosyltransferase family 9 protein [Lentimicrobium sp.]